MHSNTKAKRGSGSRRPSPSDLHRIKTFMRAQHGEIPEQSITRHMGEVNMDHRDTVEILYWLQQRGQVLRVVTRLDGVAWRLVG